MNILHVYRTYFPETQGGVEEAIRQLCGSLRAFKVESRVFTLAKPVQPAILFHPEAEIHRFPRSFTIASCDFSLSCLSGFKRLVDWADLVHYQFPWPFADLLHCAARVRKPSLLTYQSDIVRQQGWLRLYQPLMHRFLSSMDRIVATSPNYAQTSSILARHAEKLSIIPIGLDETSYSMSSDQEERLVRQCYGGNYFLFVGVLRYYKGLHILLEAAQGAPFQVVIAGAGPLEEMLKQQAAQLGLHNVSFAGFVSDERKAALYRNARALVFPSPLRSEAFGVTLLEGALFGKALISAEIGSGMSYINQHLHTGLIVPPHDAQALRQAMCLLYEDASYAARLGQAARQRYLQYFTAEQMGARYFQLYQELLR